MRKMRTSRRPAERMIIIGVEPRLLENYNVYLKNIFAIAGEPDARGNGALRTSPAGRWQAGQPAHTPRQAALLPELVLLLGAYRLLAWAQRRRRSKFLWRWGSSSFCPCH
jgi:hypothetical protein